MVQALIMILLAIPFGLEIEPGSVVAVLGLLVLVGLAVAPLSYAAGLVLKSEDAFAPLVNAIALPMLLLSGILLPMALAPDWLQTISNLNPLTHTVDAARALFNGAFDDPQLVTGVVVTAVAAVLAVLAGGKAFSRAVA
jgi:ABC-2 type transport system permease protein